MEPRPPPPPSPAARRSLRVDDGRLARGRRSRARIREAARSLFRERGFDATTLRAIAARAGMGASSIYRHIRSKEELLLDELLEVSEEAWERFRKEEDRSRTARERVQRFLDAEHALLAVDPEFTTVALRAACQPGARAARRALALQDRSIGLLAEILMAGRARGELARDADPLAAARTVAHTITGARLSWANGLVSAEDCRASVAAAVDLLFRGLEARPRTRSQAPKETS